MRMGYALPAVDGIPTHLIHTDRRSGLARIVLAPTPRLSLNGKGTGVQSSRHNTGEADVSRRHHRGSGRNRRRVGPDLAGVGPAPTQSESVGSDPAGMMAAG